MGLDAGRFLAFAPAIVLRIAFMSRLWLPFGYGGFDRWRCFFLFHSGQARRQVSDLLVQRSIFRLQLLNNADGFFQCRWHGVCIPQYRPPKGEQLLIGRLLLLTKFLIRAIVGCR